MRRKAIYSLILFMMTTKLVCGAHYIVGEVSDALDGTDPDGMKVFLWNEENTIQDNVSDIVGPSGNSGRQNTFMIDCELLDTPCEISDKMTVQVKDVYYSDARNVTVSGSGYDDIAKNITLNSPPFIETIVIDDDLSSPENEVNLVPADTKRIYCNATVVDLDNESEIESVNATFFDNALSGLLFSDDNNSHYTNESCSLDFSFGDATEVKSSCSFDVEYFANPGTWNCTMTVRGSYNKTNKNDDLTNVNELLGIGVNGPISFGNFDINTVTEEVEVNVTNYGNTKINLSLSSYAQSPGDGNAMNCTSSNIPVYYQKYNLTSSNPGQMNLSELEKYYLNSTSTQKVRYFNLTKRIDNNLNDAIKSSYWRMYVPLDVAGTCSGHTVFGATKAPSDS